MSPLPYRAVGYPLPAPAPSPYCHRHNGSSWPYPNPTGSTGRGSSALTSSFKPSIAVIIGVLTTMFSLTFLLLMYAKHCKRSMETEGNEGGAPEEAPATPAPYHVENSGIDRAVVEALPMFTFASLQGMKEGLECAVCLSRFEDLDILRLLPKCKHAFHLDCVDIWLVSHSTCPLCRHCITSNDLTLVDDLVAARNSQEAVGQELATVAALPWSSSNPRRSSVDRRDRPAQGIIVPRDSTDGAVASKRQMFSGRTDGMLLGDPQMECSVVDPQFNIASGRKLGHRIIISDVVMQQRWSDFASADILFLNTQTLFGPIERLSISRMSNTSTTDLSPPLHLLRRGEEMSTFDGKARRSSSSSRADVQEFTIVDGKARLLSSSSRKQNTDYQRNIADGDQLHLSGGVSVPGSSSSSSSSSSRKGEDVNVSSEIEMPPEPSRRSTSRLSGIINRPPLPPGLKGSSDGRGLPFLKRGFSVGTRILVDPEGRLLTGHDQRSMSEITGLERIAQSRKKDLQFVHRPSDGMQTKEEEKMCKWLSIARKTLNRFVGKEKLKTLHGPESQQRV